MCIIFKRIYYYSHGTTNHYDRVNYCQEKNMLRISSFLSCHQHQNPVILYQHLTYFTGCWKWVDTNICLLIFNCFIYCWRYYYITIIIIKINMQIIIYRCTYLYYVYIWKKKSNIYFSILFPTYKTAHYINFMKRKMWQHDKHVFI